LLIFITDLYQEQQEIYTLLDLLGALRHEIIVLHLMGHNEMELDYAGYTTLEDLETGASIQVNTGSARKLYKEQLEEYLVKVKDEVLNRNMSYRLMTMDQPVDAALREFLNARSRGW
jgi:hypothetical protein